MPLDEFTILLDNPTKSFYPGNAVTGRVIVSAPLETKTQGLKIKCYGYAKVHWTETTTKSVGTGSNRRTERVTKSYNATENYFQFKIYVVGDGKGESRIPPGRNEYPFNFVLPTSTLPCNYGGDYGKVIYEVSATIKRSWKFDKDTKENFVVNAIMNLSPIVAEPIQRQASKHFCCGCCKSGELGFEVTLPKSGFVPGEYVSPNVKLFNESGRGINETTASLTQKVTFHAQGRTKLSSKTITSVRGPGVDPNDTSVWKPVLRIPDADMPPTKLGGCGIIDLQYFVYFELHLPGMSVNLKEEIPIMLGTVPLQTGPQDYSLQAQGVPTDIARSGPGFVYPPSWFGAPTADMPLPSAPTEEAEVIPGFKA